MSDHRRFYLFRNEDVSGISGTGRIADGVLWPDGSASIRWRGACGSLEHWDELSKVLTIHGHGGKTALVWLDATPESERNPYEVFDSWGPKQ